MKTARAQTAYPLLVFVPLAPSLSETSPVLSSLPTPITDEQWLCISRASICIITRQLRLTRTDTRLVWSVDEIRRAYGFANRQENLATVTGRAFKLHSEASACGWYQKPLAGSGAAGYGRIMARRLLLSQVGLLFPDVRLCPEPGPVVFQRLDFVAIVVVAPGIGHGSVLDQATSKVIFPLQPRRQFEVRKRDGHQLSLPEGILNTNRRKSRSKRDVHAMQSIRSKH